MKLLTLLLFVGSFGVMASTSAQNTRVTLTMKKVALEDVLWKIYEETGTLILYRSEDVKSVKGLKVDVKDALIKDVLTQCLENTSLEYEFKKDAIVIHKNKHPDIVDQDVKKTSGITISGKIIDESGASVPMATVSIKSNALMGTVSDVDGKFMMTNVPKKSIVVFSFIGYKKVELDITKMKQSELKDMKIVLVEMADDLDEVVVLGHGSQRKESIVGAISTLNSEELKTPTRSLSTQLAGKVAGVSFIQQSGQPGKDGASFIIRGINSVSGSSSPLILIDGLKRSIDDVDPNDIESFSVLKDASATAVYGLEGANGIIVITTKSGKASDRPSVRVSLSSSINNSTYKPKWVDAVTYAKMKNEAYAVRSKNKPYSEEDIEKFGDDNMDFYPNIDWYNLLVKDNNLAHKGNFNISGGSNVVTYYMSGGYYTEDGMFKGDVQEFDANAKYSQFNFRSNLKADITPTTTLGLGFNGRYNTTTEPGQGVNTILNIMNEINPTLFPHEYSNGTTPVEPPGVTNPYALLTKTGFKRDYANYMSTNINVTQKLDFITKGLFMNGVAAFSKVNRYTHKYVKNYQQHRIDQANSYMGTGYDEQGRLVTVNMTPDLDDKMNFESTKATGDRTVEVQASLNYGRTFGDDLHVGGLILYKQREFLSDVPGGSGGELLINALPARTQSIASRATLDYKHKYFMDVNFGFSGSQMFTPDKRWSSFPSIGAGWLLSDESFWTGIKRTVDMLKIRASYGVVGAPGNATRFGYLASTSPQSGYSFGFGGTAYSSEYVAGVGESRLEQLGLTWERNYKIDLGLEFSLFEKFKVVWDVFRNTREDQLIDLSRLPATLGLPAVPKANQGKMRAQGFDLDVTYSDQWGDFRVNYIKGIVTYNENKIIENGQLDPRMPYQSGIGLDYGRSLSYIALGLFKDQADIDSSPVQNWNEVMPGDIKYKDVNGDGIINSEDRIWLGNVYPKWTYSLAMDFGYKNWTIAARLIGKSDMFRYISGGRLPFNSKGDNGAIYQVTVDDHWTPASYSGDASTENPNAKYPRLGDKSNSVNNSQLSTFWLKDASYLRIADVELGYTWRPKGNSPFKSVYLYGRGDNLATFSKFKDWNPEQQSSYAYPLKRTFTVGLEIGFKL